MNMHADYDAVIVGSGACGSAAAYQLVKAGLRVALVEKGTLLPRDGSTLDFNRVVHRGEFKSHEPWVDNAGRRFIPEEYFNLGGKTKWYGAALLRYGVHEFAAEAEYSCLEWPFGYGEMLPYYMEAERLLGVRTIDGEADLCRIANRLVARSPAWSYQPMPMGLSTDITRYPAEARHFDGFASVKDLKSDAETSFLRLVRGMPNLSLHTGSPVEQLVGDPRAARNIIGVRLANGGELRGRTVILAAGALHSPRLLQRYVDARGIGAQLPCAANIGRHLKYHLLTAMIGVSTARMTDLIRKTMIFLNSELPHSSVQPLGFDAELISTLIPRLVPRLAARLIGEHSYGFFLQTEDGAHRDNRVVDGDPAGGLPCIDYDARRTPAAAEEHRRLVRSFRTALARAGLLAFSQRIGLAGTAHVSGTLPTGTDANSSVVDSDGRVHGINALYVVDGSILPRSSRVNPSLTIYAWALRTAGRLAQRLLAPAAV